ncbi:DUF4192 domain-containing protein [Sinomonas sp. JGH33]|uniref:DUF4192 domain-containing protein n=1 Tax=Sinomonas terricola TaxID=3110330 RepID=A0ABU5T3L8_9MICC|nr:DUF4192 domain-containing protein [Sinomonas sp. JGH33]MEA5454254.1 DUF4192 domain-containing protein [Sinomonas sp. JGH33]
MDETTCDHPDGNGFPEGLSPVPGALCIREPEDLLGFIPHTIGEWPRESLVAVSIGAGSVGVTVRVDLPPRGEELDLGEYADAVVGHLVTDVLAEGAVFALYTAEPWAAVESPPRSRLVEALQGAFAEAGLPLLDAWLVGDRFWRSLLCERSSCCPWPGKPLETIAASALGTELVFRGSTYERFDPEPEASTGRGTSGDGVTPRALGRDRSAAAPRAAAPSGAAAEALLERLRGSADSWWEPPVFAAALAAWDATLGSDRVPEPHRVALLAATLARPAIRDAVMVSAAIGGRAAWRGSLALDGSLSASGPIPELPGGLGPGEVERLLTAWSAQDGPSESAALEFGAALLGATRTAPDWERIARLERLARRLTEFEDPEVRAPALSLLGWICWIRGRGTKAAGHFRRVLSVQPGYRFAKLFGGMIESGELAGWAKRPETAWRRLKDVA